MSMKQQKENKTVPPMNKYYLHLNPQKNCCEAHLNKVPFSVFHHSGTVHTPSMQLQTKTQNRTEAHMNSISTSTTFILQLLQLDYPKQFYTGVLTNY